MSPARRRGRPAPLRWSGVVAVVGAGVLATGAYLQFDGDDHAGASTTPSPPVTSTSPRTPVVASGKPLPKSGPSSSRTPVNTRPGRPTAITIPQLNVSAPVVSIKAVDAALTPPSDPTTVGWWSGGAQPGAKRGSAVITGHTVHTGGGAFDNLGQLVPGSVVQLTTVRGPLRYRVATVTTYRKATLAKRAAQVFDQGVRGRLVLVTCEDWNGSVYLSNVVVVALPMA
ncbi:sortase domain-bontaining protein [Kribbella sp. NPDC004536]|uniref:sortase domain-containing protein n=1 Tax=Kribbella sp. NPDC004536 TaxID=3364106 RepID=UPI0036824411